MRGAGGLAGFSAEQVEEVRMVVRMLPVFFTTILFWTIYAQVGARCPAHAQGWGAPAIGSPAKAAVLCVELGS